MELHEFYVRQHSPSLVRDGHAVARCHFRIGRLAINLPESAGGQQHRAGPQFVKRFVGRSEEHTSELQSRVDLVCRLLLEKKKKKKSKIMNKTTYLNADGTTYMYIQA